MPNEKVAYRALILQLTSGQERIRLVQQEFMAGLGGYVSHKKSGRLAAQSKLLSDVPKVGSLIKTDLKQIKQNKAAKESGAAYQKRFNEEAPKVRHTHADPVVQGFEASYKETRTSKAEIKQRVKDVARYMNLENAVAMVPINGNPDHLAIVVAGGQKAVPIVELWFGDQRFMKTDEKGVYVHRTKPDRQYVKDRNGFFIQRYLIRNLSK